MAGLTTVTSGGIADGSITNADISSSASIDASKVSGLSTDKIEEGNTAVECVDSGSDGHITFDTEGEERARILSNGKILVNAIADRTGWSNGTIGSNLLQIERASSGGDAALTLCANAGTNALGTASIFLGKTRGTSVGAVTAVADGDQLGQISFQGADGSELVEAARIEGRVDGTTGTNTGDMPGSLRFYTTPDNSPTVSERMRIDSAGKVGIGVNNPDAYHNSANQLVVGGATNSGITVVGGTSGSSNVWFADGTSGDAAYRGMLRYEHSDDAMVFKTAGDSERMRIDSTGNVGIGTTSPDVSLDVEDTQAELQLKSTSGSNSAGLRFIPGGETNAYYIYADGSRNLIFEDHTTERMKIASDGVVTINGLNVGKGPNQVANNTVLGVSALNDVSADGGGNTVIGFECGRELTSGDNNTFVGKDVAQLGVVTGNLNVGVGYQTLQDLTSGLENTCMGNKAGANLTTGDYNVIVGNQAAQSGTITGEKNVIIGHQAGEDLSTGYNNVCIGPECGAPLTTGASNVFIGDRSGYYQPDGAITGNYNVCIGLSTGASLSSGGENVCIGRAAGGNLTTGTNNTFVGYNAGLGSASGTNSTYIGYNAGWTGGAGVGNAGNTNNIIVFGNTSVTDLYCNDTSISSSDQRDKADITDFTHGLDWVTQLRPVTYKWDKRDWYVDWEKNPDTKLSEVTTDGTHKKDRINIGLLAQDVQTIEKSAGFATSSDNELICKTSPDGQQMGLKYERLVPVLINAIKELKTANDALTARVAALEAG